MLFRMRAIRDGGRNIERAISADFAAGPPNLPRYRRKVIVISFRKAGSDKPLLQVLDLPPNQGGDAMLRQVNLCGIHLERGGNLPYGPLLQHI